MKKRRTDSDEKAKSSKHKKATRAPTSVDGHLSMFADFTVPLFFCFCFFFVPANVVLKRAVLWDLWLKKPELSSTLRSHKVLRTGVIGSSIEVFIIFFFLSNARDLHVSRVSPITCCAG